MIVYKDRNEIRESWITSYGARTYTLRLSQSLAFHHTTILTSSSCRSCSTSLCDRISFVLGNLPFLTFPQF